MLSRFMQPHAELPLFIKFVGFIFLIMQIILFQILAVPTVTLPTASYFRLKTEMVWNPLCFT